MPRKKQSKPKKTKKIIKKRRVQSKKTKTRKSQPRKIKAKKTTIKKRRKVVVLKLSSKRRSSIFQPEKVKDLFRKGKNRGFVTLNEILSFFPNLEKDIKGLEKLYQDL